MMARTIRVYRNGVQAGAFAYTGSMKHDCTDTTAIGSRNDNQQHWFPGTIDEVRIYGRALPPQEIADLYHAGWQAATLPSGAVGTERTSWTAAVPAGLEGSYRIEMRGRDVAERAEVVNEPSLLWRGEADNLKPRVTLSLNTTTNQYTTVAEDYHLVETSFSSPCGAGVINTRETFRSPWYLGSTGDSQKLYRLKAVCPKPAGAVTEQATACDSFNNCTTVVGATTTAQLTATESAASNPELVAPDKGSPSGFEISAPAVVTTSHYYEPRTIDVIGAAIAKGNLYADRHALANVQVAIAGAAGPATLSEPAAQRPYTVTWTFPWRLPNAATLPDGVSYTATITATDLAGRTTAVKQTLIADVVRPAPVTLNLTSNGQPVEPGAIIRETAPDLALTWTSSSDGSGLSPYQASWRIEDAYTTTIQTSLHTPDDRVAHVTAGEAQRIAVGLTSRDIHSNERWQEFGSVLVDGPLTPDFITPLPSPALGSGAGDEAWMDSGCTLLGADRRIADLGSSSRILPFSLQRRIAQHGYATWDHRALRLAWTGANWSDDGDLFIYLDTVPGGTNSTFTPYPVTASGTTVILPADLQADALIWVQDATTASLLRWDGNLWAFEASLSPEQYHFDAARTAARPTSTCRSSCWA